MTRTAVRSSADSAPIERWMRDFERERRPHDRKVAASAGTSHSPNGTSRIAPEARRSAATDGRIRASIGTPAQASAGPASSLSDLERRRGASRRAGAPATSQTERRFEQARQPDHGDGHERQVAPRGAVGDLPGVARSVTRLARHTRARASRRPTRGGPRATSVLTTRRRLEPRPARLADCPSGRCRARPVVGVGVDGDDGSRRRAPRRARSTARSSRCR